MLDYRPLGLRGLGLRSSDRGRLQMKPRRPKVEPDPNEKRKPVPSRLKMRIEELERQCLNLIDQMREWQLAYEGTSARFNAFKREDKVRKDKLLRQQAALIRQVNYHKFMTLMRGLDSIRIDAQKAQQENITEQARHLRKYIHDVAGTPFGKPKTRGAEGEGSSAKKKKV